MNDICPVRLQYDLCVGMHGSIRAASRYLCVINCTLPTRNMITPRILHCSGAYSSSNSDPAPAQSLTQLWSSHWLLQAPAPAPLQLDSGTWLGLPQLYHPCSKCHVGSTPFWGCPKLVLPICLLFIQPFQFWYEPINTTDNIFIIFSLVQNLNRQC